MTSRSVRAAASACRPPEPVGERDDWPDGIEMHEDVQMRQMPIGDWDEQTWVSADGLVVPRIYEPSDDTWEWQAVRTTHVDDDGELTVDVGHGTRRTRMRVVRAIALAWVSCPETLISPHATLIQQPGDTHARNIGWREAGATREVRPCHPITCSRAAPSDTDVWLPLKCVWTSVNGDVVRRTDHSTSGRYLISRGGWVWSQSVGGASRGRRDPSGDCWIALHDDGLARVADVLHYTFAAPKPVAPTRRRARQCDETQSILSGPPVSIDEWCSRANIARATVWARLVTYARDAEWDAACKLWTRVPTSLQHDMRDRPTQEAKARLERLRRDLASDHVLCVASDTDAYGMIRVARALERRDELRKLGAESH